MLSFPKSVEQCDDKRTDGSYTDDATLSRYRLSFANHATNQSESDVASMLLTSEIHGEG